jgi:ArsR family transcriptional regulator
MDSDEAIKALGALAQDTRLRICTLLAAADDAGLPAGDISVALGVPQNTLSFHLAQLENAGLIRSRRQGRYVIYSAARRFVDELILWLADSCRGKPAKKSDAA